MLTEMSDHSFRKAVERALKEMGFKPGREYMVALVMGKPGERVILPWNNCDCPEHAKTMCRMLELTTDNPQWFFVVLRNDGRIMYRTEQK